MTPKFLTALGAAYLAFALPAVAAPRNEHATSTSPASQRRASPRAYQAPHYPFGARAARREQVFSHEDLARQPAAPQSGTRRGPGQPSRAWDRGSLRLQKAPFGQRPDTGYAPSARPNSLAGAPGRENRAFGHSWEPGQRHPNQSDKGEHRRPDARAWRHRGSGANPDYAHRQHDFTAHHGHGALEGPHPQYNYSPREYRYNGRGRFDHHDTGHYWERGWERDYRSARRYHWRRYILPQGWYAQQWRFGMYLPYLFWTRNYWIDNYWDFGLPQPPYGYVWVREGNDALLINEQDGYILQVVYGVFY